MWCYQRPGFTALLLAELQRQQQCSQFCDTVLQAEGILVPAHSCVLSALSTQLSCALSSTPPPPAGQKHLVDFQTLRACTLLQIMRLLYSGEMGGEGERERQEAIAAAAKLGISGLVEVRKGDHNDRREGLGQQKEAGVQTELLTCEGNGARQSKWTKEVRDGSTLLWKETPSGGERDIGTQTEELEWSAAPSSHPATPLQTIDRTAIQTSAEPDSHLLPPNTPYIPVSLCPKDGNQASDHPSPSSVLIAPSEESTAAGHTPVFVLPPSHFSALPLSPSISHASAALSTQDTQVPPVFAADSQSWWAEAQEASRKVMAAEGGEGEGFEQFQGNIPGFISYFLNPDKKENPQGRRAGRKRGGTGGTRRAGTGEGGARRGRSRKRETTDIEKVVVSKLQNSWMRWRWGVQASRTGKGGGTTGRKFYHQTREHLQSNKTRRRCGKAWQISQMAVSLPAGSERGGQAQRGRKRSATQQLPQDVNPISKRWSARAKSVSSPMSHHNIQANTPLLSQPQLSTKLSPSPDPISLPAPHMPPATSLLHTNPLHPLPPPAQEDQVDQFERLLEEVMMGLDIIPNNNNSNLHSKPPPQPASGTTCAYPSSGNDFIQKQQQQYCLTSGLQQAGSGSTVETAGSSSDAVGEVPVLQQPEGEGELTDILDDFLRSFEQHISSCSTREDQNYTQASQLQRYSTCREYNKPQARAKSAHTPYVDSAQSPSLPQAVIPWAHAPNSALHTPTPPLLSPPTDTAQPPPVSASLPHSCSVVTNNRQENKARTLTRRQRREKTSSPKQISGVKLTELLEREKSYPKSSLVHLKLCSVSLSSAALTGDLTIASPHIQPKVPGTVRGPGRPLGRKKKSLKKQTRVGKPDEEPDKSDETTKIVLDQGGKAAQQPVQMPMVTQETTGPLPGGKTDVASQFSCQSLQVQSTTKSGTAETSPPLVKYPVNSFPGEDGTFKWTRKTYPIRSRLKQANIMSTPLVEETEEHPPADSLPEDKAQLAQLIRINQNNLQKGNAKNKFKTKQSSSRKKRQVGNSSNVESLRVSVSPPVECFGMDEKIEKSKDKQKEVKVLSEGVALGTSRRAEKRCTESEEEKSSEADVAKRVCLEQVVPTTSKPWAPGLEPVLSVSEPQPRTQDGSQEVAVTVEMEDEVDVEVLSQPDDENNRDWLLWTCKGGGDISQEGEQEEEEDTAWTNIKLMDEETENSSDKAIVVDGDSDATPDLDDLEFSCEEQAENWPNVLNVKAKTPVWSHLGVAKPPLSPPSQPAAEVSLGSTGSWEEEGEEDEVDVIGGSSPVPEALPISWTEPSESGEEQEEIDVTGVEMDYVSSTSLLSSLLQTGKEVGVLPPCHLCSGREELCAKCWLFVQNQMETLSCGENLQRKQCVIICKEAKASLIKINKNRTDVQLIELSIKN
ncbi:uncharacterized protein LOC115366132 isoform X2 [Myripristis murdjan]|uniref:uncharacterized protein LOC115366132 isoform X2 n=1 Tax=Myripristis murdjan TaxID=586833 RepID=UPI00117610D4|nr:BTB/POZ domain-containing protein 18 isoform X2 [Myripristis murdjan]